MPEAVEAADTHWPRQIQRRTLPRRIEHDLGVFVKECDRLEGLSQVFRQLTQAATVGLSSKSKTSDRSTTSFC